MTRRTASFALMAGLLVLGAALGATTQEPAPDPSIAGFTAAVDRYVGLRARLAEPLPPLHASRIGWSTLVAKRYLASAIRTARRDAHPGSIFTPPAAVLFMRRIDAALTTADRLMLAGPDDGESSAPLVLVNEPLAPEWLTPLPPRLLEQLPPLPRGIEYWFVGTSLVLWDADAEIAIDVLPDALH